MAGRKAGIVRSLHHNQTGGYPPWQARSFRQPLPGRTLLRREPPQEHDRRKRGDKEDAMMIRATVSEDLNRNYGPGKADPNRDLMHAQRKG